MQAAHHTIRLEGAQTIREAEGLALRLREALAAHDGVRVETQAVSAADVAVLQVMVAAHRTARRDGRTLSIEAASGGALEAALQAGGLAAPGVIRLEAGAWTGLEIRDEEHSR